MMREILFKGKRLDNDEWLEGSLLVYGKRYFIIPSEELIESEVESRFYWRLLEKHCEVDPETVGQYTGLTDKNGKRIFEGDVLRYGLFCDYECFLESIEHPDDYDGEVYDQGMEIDVVKWCGERYDYPAFDLNDHQFECNGLSQIMCGDYEYEIIGNIHDDPLARYVMEGVGL